MTRLPSNMFYGNPCSKCGETLRYVYRKGCVACRKKSRKASSKKHKARYREKYAGRYKSRNVTRVLLNMSEAEYFALCEAQNRQCVLCGKTPKGNLCADHCHKTIKFRGLLCRTCNVGLECFSDDPEILRKAIEYLTANRPC